jgi:hypothetical protein
MENQRRDISVCDVDLQVSCGRSQLLLRAIDLHKRASTRHCANLHLIVALPIRHTSTELRV